MVSGAAVFVAVPLVTAYVSVSAAKIIGDVLFAAWVIVLLRFFFVSGEYVYWPCPRCGKPFHYLHYLVRWYGRWNNPFARHCVHCGLAKWADSDPDPKLKRELDPFRSGIYRVMDLHCAYRCRFVAVFRCSGEGFTFSNRTDTA